MQPLSCTQIDGTVLLVKMPRSCCFLHTTFVRLISIIIIFVLPSILLQKCFDKFGTSVKHVIFKIDYTLFLNAIAISSVCLPLSVKAITFAGTLSIFGFGYGFGRISR